MPLLGYIVSVLLVSLLELGMLLGPTLILGFILNHFSTSIQRRTVLCIGMKPYLATFGWLGTSVHECGHALFCLLFRHKIHEVKLFEPDAATGTLGYVKHSYNERSVYQQIGNFFIGVGPIILGSLILFIAYRILISPSPASDGGDTGIDLALSSLALAALSNAWLIITSLFQAENLANWRFYLFLYIAFSVGGSITLSKADLRGASKGLMAIVLLVLAVNFCTLWLGDFSERATQMLLSSGSTFTSMLIFAVALNAIMATIIGLICKVLGRG